MAGRHRRECVRLERRGAKVRANVRRLPPPTHLHRSYSETNGVVGYGQSIRLFGPPGTPPFACTRYSTEPRS